MPPVLSFAGQDAMKTLSQNAITQSKQGFYQNNCDSIAVVNPVLSAA